MFLTENSDYLTYMASILIDNAWKYSIDNSTFTVNINRIENEYWDIKFTNKSKSIPTNINIFSLGIKVEKESKGFGYGLNWIKDLEANYNDRTEKDDFPFKILHNQLTPQKDHFFQEFILKNVKI